MTEPCETENTDLSALIELYKAGAITAEEFKTQKEKLTQSPVSNEVDEGLRALDDKLADGCLKWVVGAVVIIAIIFGINMCGSDKPKGPTPASDYEIRSTCEKWVEDKLKSPATAKFSNHDIRPDGYNKWNVTGDVDSENGFGALVRTPWTCEIRLDDETWRGGVKF